MAALNLAQIPTEIDTLEKLLLWAGLAAKATYQDYRLAEAPNETPIRMMQIPIIEDVNGEAYMIVRSAIKLDPTYDTDNSKKLWEHAVETVSASIPVRYTA